MNEQIKFEEKTEESDVPKKYLWLKLLIGSSIVCIPMIFIGYVDLMKSSCPSPFACSPGPFLLFGIIFYFLSLIGVVVLGIIGLEKNRITSDGNFSQEKSGILRMYAWLVVALIYKSIFHFETLLDTLIGNTVTYESSAFLIPIDIIILAFIVYVVYVINKKRTLLQGESPLFRRILFLAGIGTVWFLIDIVVALFNR